MFFMMDLRAHFPADHEIMIIFRPINPAEPMVAFIPACPSSSCGAARPRPPSPE
jgi:hypothetical protein